MLLSIHIPKTAGTNFTKTLQIIYGARIHEDYGTEMDLTTVRTPDPLLVADPVAFGEKFSVIHGHYHFLKYRDVFPKAATLATMRHPVTRMVSQYRHIALHGDPSIPQHRNVMEGRWDLMELVRRAKYATNAMSYFLEGLSIDDLTHAIIQEHFSATVERFCAAVGFDPKDARIKRLVAKPINSRENSDWDSKAIPIDPDCFPMIEKQCQRDLDLYNRALERFVT